MSPSAHCLLNKGSYPLWLPTCDGLSQSFLQQVSQSVDHAVPPRIVGLRNATLARRFTPISHWSSRTVLKVSISPLWSVDVHFNTDYAL